MEITAKRPYAGPGRSYFGQVLPWEQCCAEIRAQGTVRYVGCKQRATWRCEVRLPDGHSMTLYYCDQHATGLAHGPAAGPREKETS